MHKSNRIVHGLWIGPALSKLELLTIRSFVEHGHEFHLWVYDKIDSPLPEGAILRDGNAIFDRSAIFQRDASDPENQLGAGSYATFSDLFRVKVLHDEGGIWSDMDVLCLRPVDISAPYIFRAHRMGAVMNFIKAPKGSRL